MQKIGHKHTRAHTPSLTSTLSCCHKIKAQNHFFLPPSVPCCSDITHCLFSQLLLSLPAQPTPQAALFRFWCVCVCARWGGDSRVYIWGSRLENKKVFLLAQQQTDAACQRASNALYSEKRCVWCTESVWSQCYTSTFSWDQYNQVITANEVNWWHMVIQDYL